MIERIFTAAMALALAACASAPQMPADIAAKVKAIGPVIDPPKTAAIYAPLQPKEPYQGVRVARDLKYGPDARQALDVFTPEAVSSTAPVLMFVHGGAFVGGNKRAPGSPFYDNIMLAAARAGMVGVNVTYRLAPQHKWPAGAADVGAAVKWVRDHIRSHGGDPARVTLMGHSAGAVHVASYVAFPEHHRANGIGIARAIVVSGLFDFTRMKPVGKPEAAYFGGLAGTAEISSLTGLSRTTIPLMVAYAELDPAPFIAQAKLLNEALCSYARCPRLVYLPGHSHMSEVYSIGTSDASLGAPVLDFARAR
ncbi:MAG: alpha/beta hydrolase [Betaproteobacteria bacterium]